ncbi:MAG: hypothetical protein FWD88_00630 [Treponema sp.]|nr:hypothetical protein [Treponema sp.]
MGTFIASVCILVYLGALVSVIVRISTSMDERRDLANLEFELLVREASAAGSAGVNDDFFAIIQNALHRSVTLEGVIIYGQGGVLDFFEKEHGYAIVVVNGSPRFRGRPGFSRQDLFRPLPGMWNVNIEAVAGVFNYAELAEILKRAMILIAGALAVAFFTLLVESSVQRRRRLAFAYAGGRPRDAAPQEARREDAGRPAAAQPKETRREPQVETRKEAETEKPRPAPSVHKPGSYSERGHVVRKEHTEGRLAEEIARCMDAGQDIAFIAVEFKPPEADNYYARLAADAARFFSSREFICERSDRGLSIICSGLSLDMGFLNASEFHSRIMSKYPSVFKLKTDLCMGVSASSGREVNAARLVFEAEEALERAMLDPASHIIAFKSDPDKFRAYMEGHRAGSAED